MALAKAEIAKLTLAAVATLAYYFFSHKDKVCVDSPIDAVPFIGGCDFRETLIGIVSPQVYYYSLVILFVLIYLGASVGVYVLKRSFMKKTE